MVHDVLRHEPLQRPVLPREREVEVARDGRAAVAAAVDEEAVVVDEGGGHGAGVGRRARAADRGGADQVAEHGVVHVADAEHLRIVRPSAGVRCAGRGRQTLALCHPAACIPPLFRPPPPNHWYPLVPHTPFNLGESNPDRT